MRGKFITVEGGEGVGKSTQVDMLVESIKAAGIEIVHTREPGGTEAAEEIRKLFLEGEEDRWDAVSETLLMYAARRNHVLKVIYPALEAGKWVVCDRFTDSTMAYQGYARKFGRENVETIEEVTLGDFGPDLTLILDVPFDIAFERIKARRQAADRMEKVYERIHRVVRGAFLDIAGRNPERCHIIDASGTIEDVHTRVNFAVGSRLGVLLTSQNVS